MAAGDFTAAQLAAVKVKLREFWQDPRTSNDDSAYSIETIRAISENQRVSTTPLRDSATCQDVSVTFLKNCDDAVEACASGATCVITGTEMEADKADYAPNYCKNSKPILIWDDDCKGMYSFEEKMAEGIKHAENTLLLDLDKTAMTFLDTNASANLYTGGTGVIVGTETTFDSTAWNASLMAQLALTAEYNNINMPVFVSGTNLWEIWWNARNGSNCCGEKDTLSRLGAFPDWYFDPKVMATVLAENATFVFDAGDVAFFNKRMYAHTSPMRVGADTVTFSMQSERLQVWDNGSLQPVWFDVVMQDSCKEVNSTFYKGVAVRLTLRGGLITTPAPCDDSTGILKFLNVVAAP